jgi:hypothetical protein
MFFYQAGVSEKKIYKSVFMKNIFRKISFALAICFLTFHVYSQNMKTTIKIQAMDMAGALVKNNFNAFSKYMHPKVIEIAGGKQKLKNNMDSADAMMKQFGMEFKKIIIGHPGDIINYKGQLQCVVPQSTNMKSPLGELYLETSLIAISMDNGQHWYFIDTNVYKLDKLKTALPDLSPKLLIPPQKEPKFTVAGSN